MKKITIFFPAYRKVPSGGYKILYQYANLLARDGYEVSLVHALGMPNDPKQNTSVNRIKLMIKKSLNWLRVYAPNTVSWFPLDDRIKVINLREVIEKNFPEGDILIATAWQTAELIKDFSVNKGEKIYFVQGMENWEIDDARLIDTWKSNMEKIVVSKWLQKQLLDQNVASQVVPNFINSNEFYVSNPIKERKLVISMLYHKVPWKGSDIGLQVINKLMDDYPEIEILVFGVAARPNELREEITYFENPSVDDLREKIYNKSMIYLMTSRSEGWGLTATEAMACGAALVTTDSGGVSDFAINNETALVAAIDDVTDLVNKAEALIDDPALRYKLIDNGLAVVKKFNIEYSYKKFEHVIAGLNRNELS
ncbi:glycosyltransferase family 4 protein [Enterococcus xiangfangensis]|uniref:Glycosyltransferase family 4 protein n=1 Tax=Enterococcus xiangfangensis TaxID=1296537 RepID=A0ABU3FA77_9ENTE|nr:glycosyltransferase family 4 protein [Enterococcus xiangfangensis]MDT2759583.1 glycosyltransferase family 4 protein [Enterococcus xiangfangensis]NBK09682.1 glycosyltransferase [Enterococcus asini]